MSASRMREILAQKHPSRYVLRSEQSITYFISALVRKHKKAFQRHITVGNPTATKRTRFSPEVSSTLNKIVDEKPVVIPRHAWKLLLEALCSAIRT